MKLLRRLLLVNWHYYDLEWIEFDRINFLTGKTGAGKSTLIDALQIVLLGDTSGQGFFNKAANDRSKRQLKGYLRGEYADDGGGGFLNLRNGPFTSYIACEFVDHEQHVFTLGAAFDCNYGPSDEHCFFILKRDRIPEGGFVMKDLPMPIKDLKSWLRRTYDAKHYDVCTTSTEYRQKVLGHFGALSERFFPLLRKAVSFSPIVDIEGFITQNLCDARRPPDLNAMQDNIRQYKRLEREADILRKRIVRLEEVSRAHAALSEQIQRRTVFAFLVDRAELEAKKQEFAWLNNAAAMEREALAAHEEERARLDGDASRFARERDAAVEERAQNSVHKILQKLQAEREETSARASALRSVMDGVVRKLLEHGLSWRKAAEDGMVLAAMGASAPRTPPQGAEEFAAAAASLRVESERLLDMNPTRLLHLDATAFAAWRDASVRFSQQATLFGGRLDDQLRDARVVLTQCDDRLVQLRDRIKPFDSSVLRCRQVLEQELAKEAGHAVRVDILADRLEITDTRWTDVIEGYLAKQKQYLLVEAGAYPSALRILDRLRAEEHVHDVGLIDGEKVRNAAPRRLAGSLAEVVETADPQARAYIDFLLGQVVRCDRVEDLRNHDRAVTDQGLLYQGYVARAMDPGSWAHPLIGVLSIERQIQALEEERPALEGAVLRCSASVERSRAMKTVQPLLDNEAGQYLDTIRDAEGLESLEARQREIQNEIDALDLTWIARISERIAALATSMEETRMKIRTLAERIGRTQGTLRDLESIRVPTLERVVQELAGRLQREYPDSFRNETGEPRFLEELASRKGSSERVAADFRPQVGLRDSAVEKAKQNLYNLRADFNRESNATYDVASIGNETYDTLLLALRDQRLPDYGERIVRAREMAYEQFVSQFLAEIKASIDDVKDRISATNRALRDYRWGTDSYRFEVTENPEFKRFYDMITDPDLMEGNNILSQSYRARHGATIEELFGRLEDAGTGTDSDARSETERNIRIFTDYRTYLRFDMISTDDQNQTQRLSRTLMKKSGGETQTPFYVAMLASFAQLYHLSDRKWNCIRLIVFDEAFSKMDGERIRESLQMLSKVGFQCILSAPPEKIGDIAPLVDRNLAVIRKGQHSTIHAFDPRHLDPALVEAIEEA